MDTLKRLGLQLAVLVVAMLAAIGGWEVYRGTVGTANSQIKGGSEAFKCYELKVLEEKPEVKGTVVEVDDLFGTERVKIKDAELLCVQAAVFPVKKEPLKK